MSPDDYLATVHADIRNDQTNSARTQSKNEGQIGASDFVCRERMRRIIVQAPETDKPDKWAAWVGTAVDAEFKRVRQAQRPSLIHDAEWPLTIDGRTIVVHPDEVDPAEPSVTDLKSNNGLAVARAGLMGDANRIQRHLQYLAGYKAGVLPAEGIVRNLIVDRSGKDGSHHVEQEPFDVTVAEQAAEFVREVHYAIDNGEEASKDWPRTMCRTMCPYFTSCRQPEITDADEKLDPDTAVLVDACGTAKVMVKEAEQLISELRDELDGVQGKTDTHEIFWVSKNTKNGPSKSLHVNVLKETG